MNIFYFSGTGNSYYSAKQIQQKINTRSTLDSITNYQMHETVNLKDDVLIVSPVYYYGVPYIVMDFIEKIALTSCKSLSIVFTAEYPNGIAINIVKGVLRKKGINLHSAFYIKMPTNFILKSRMLNNKEVGKVYKSALKKIDKISQYMNTGKNIIEGESKLYNLLMRSKYKYYSEWATLYEEFDSYFSNSSKCNFCGKCIKHCPSKNIEVGENIKWKGDCYGCLKCINICPQNAITWKEQTIGKKQYFNNCIRIEEFK